jgi:hypothetical protein
VWLSTLRHVAPEGLPCDAGRTKRGCYAATQLATADATRSRWARDSAGVKGLTWPARRKAGELVRLVRRRVSDVRAHRAEQQRAALARAAEQAAREQAADQPLQRLVLAYCDHLD